MGSGGVAIAALPTVICLKVPFSDGLGGAGYSGRLTEMASSSSWACSMMPGASSNQEAELHLYDILYRQS